MSRALPWLALWLSACGGVDEGPKGERIASDDERGSIGPPGAAAEYCEGLGYTLEAVDGPTGQEADCVFPEGSRCSQWTFYRGECGQEHSYCVRQGGALSSEERTHDGWSALVAICRIDGAECEEWSYFKTHRCD